MWEIGNKNHIGNKSCMYYRCLFLNGKKANSEELFKN